jgi:predicted dehydrogenase
MVAHHTRHKPQNLKIKELIDAGELGTHFNFMASCCSSAGLELQESDWRAQPDVNPGGPLLQCGIHTLDVLISFFGRVSRVAALIQDKVTPLPVDDNVSLLIEFASGVTGTFQTNYTTAYSHSLDILGQDAALHVREHITGMGQTQLYLQRRIRDLHEPWEMLRIPAAPVAGLPAGAGLLEQQFLAEIAGGTPCYENMRDSIDALKIVHAAVESSKNNRVVTF